VETEEELIVKANLEEERHLHHRQAQLEDTISCAWHVEEIDDSNGFPDAELLDWDDDSSLSTLMSSLQRRIEQRDNHQEEVARVGRTLRKKLTHYERQNVEALGKLRALEPQLSRNESEYEKVSKEARKMEKKNRALMETQRHYELDRKELRSELQGKTHLLKQTDAQKRRQETDARRKMEEHQRKLRHETDRKLADHQSRTARELSEKDEKLYKLKGILDKTTTPMSARTRKPVMTPAMTARTAKFQNLRARTASESKMSTTVTSMGTPTRATSASDIKPPKPARPAKRANLHESEMNLAEKCNVAIVHEKGARSAHVINVANNERKTITLVDQRDI